MELRDNGQLAHLDGLTFDQVDIVKRALGQFMDRISPSSESYGDAYQVWWAIKEWQDRNT